MVKYESNIYFNGHFHPIMSIGQIQGMFTPLKNRNGVCFFLPYLTEIFFSGVMSSGVLSAMEGYDSIVLVISRYLTPPPPPPQKKKKK